MKASTARPLRVLIVDDQNFMRMALRTIVEAEADMVVVGEASTGLQAISQARDLKPDLVTMDIEMPGMDGCEAAGRILRDVVPAPAIIMVSTHTRLGAAATLKALQLGAVDFVGKTTLRAFNDIDHIGAELIPKLRVWGRGAPQRLTRPPPPPGDMPAFGEKLRSADLVAVAASTGGPHALTRLFKAAGRIAPPVVVAQHMPRFFTAGLATLLAEEAGIIAQEGANGTRLEPGTVTVLPGAQDGLVVRKAAGRYELRIVKFDASPHPSANALFESAAMAAAAPLAVVLTGMGDDGTRGALSLRKRGAAVLVQSPESCVVGGMPKSIMDAGAATHVLSLEAIGALLATIRLATPISDQAS